MPDSSEPLRSVIVGAGRLGARHAGLLAGCEDFDLMAFCDISEEALQTVASEFPDPRAYTDLQEMLEAERPDVVIVATPGGSHAELVVTAAGAGVRGIFCEKPMATSLGEGRAMVEACRANGVELLIGHQRRLGAPLVEMRRLIEAGAIGDVYLMRASCGGDIVGDGTHAVNSLQWLAGDEDVVWVFGQVYRNAPDPTEPKSSDTVLSGGYRYGYPVETGGMGVFEFASGLRAELYCGDIALPGRAYQDYEVFGTEGRLWRGGDAADSPVLIRDSDGGGWRGASALQDGWTGGYGAFARTIRHGALHPLNGDVALKGLEVLMAIYESARTNSKIELPLRQEAFPLELLIEEGRWQDE